MKVALYCPIKPPDHPIASGDRTIARNVIKALERAGHKVTLASSFIAYSKRSDVEILAERKADALLEANAVLRQLRNDMPDIWLTYHPYDKAPDWIGPIVTQALKIPYLTLEAAKTGQGDAWLPWRAEAQAGLRMADLHLVMKPSDRDYLTELLGQGTPLMPITPFIETDGFPKPAPLQSPPVQIVTAGQMRPGKKVENYRHLAQTVERLKATDWHLTIFGGGPAEEQVRGFFSNLSNTVTFAGEVPRETLLAEMAKADLFVWPGWREPIGMVYLEAQLCGLPVAAFSDMGVPLVVKDGETGLLAPPDDCDALAAQIDRLVQNSELRESLAQNARQRVAEHHGLEGAAASFTQAFRTVLAGSILDFLR